MEQPEHDFHRHHNHHQQPNVWSTKLLSLQSDIISDCLLALTSPFITLFSLATTAFHRLEDTKATGDSDVSTTAPSTEVNGSSILLKKAVLGFVGSAYVFLVLTTVMVVSTLLGVCLVRLWVEEPLQISEKLYFDYTDPNPSAIFDFGFEEHNQHHKLRKSSLPIGHTCNFRLVFVMPESDYNREIGMFQVIAASFSSNNDVISSSSFPWMLRFRNQPIRTLRTFMMGAPLLLGITNEIQTVSIPILRYKERHYPRTQSIKVNLVPRAGMPFLPQIYEAELIVRSEPPWMKRLVRNWKWTFYVWTSLYIYILLVLVLVCFYRSVMFPALTLTAVSGDQRVAGVAVSDEEREPRRVVVGGRGGASSSLRRWRESRGKRKAMVLGGGFAETTAAGSDATSMSVTRDEDASVMTEEVGDSESVCQ